MVEVQFDDNSYDDDVGDDQERLYGDDRFEGDVIQSDGSNDDVRFS